MTTTPQEPLGDDEMTTEGTGDLDSGTPATDADGTDGTDGSDADGTDGAAL